MQGMPSYRLGGPRALLDAALPRAPLGVYAVSYGMALMVLQLFLAATLPPGGIWTVLGAITALLAGIASIYGVFYKGRTDGRAALDNRATALDRRQTEIADSLSKELQDVRDELREAKKEVALGRKDTHDLQLLVYDLREKVGTLTSEVAVKNETLAKLYEENGRLRQEIKVKDDTILALNKQGETWRAMIDDMLRAMGGQPTPDRRGSGLPAPLPA